MNTENDFTSRYYSNILKQATQYGIDCKVYGAICTISEIKNAVPLVHGPEGCAYYPRFFPTDAIRMKLLGERYHPTIYVPYLGKGTLNLIADIYEKIMGWI